jgi:hypothetical protein
MKKLSASLAMLLVLALLLPAAAFAETPAAPDYHDETCWAYRENGSSDKAADVFFLAPTIYGGKEGSYNMPLDSVKHRVKFLSAIDMEKGIYDDNARFFAPYYRQMGLSGFLLPTEEQKPYIDLAFEDVKAAFETYMAEDNGGRPVILAGFSQGAIHAIRLIKECFDTPERQAQLVACYAIGWHLTQEELDACPWLRRAEGEDDIGSVISFECEAENITDSLIVPEGVRCLSINPLNWKTDGTPAGKELNLGACFPDIDGNITKEIPAFTGGYLDDVRGTLKVTEVTPEEYPANLFFLEDGMYHIYDHQFFYRNLEKNVQTRLNAYLEEQAVPEKAAA